MNMKSKRYLLQSINVLNLLMTAAAIGFFITFLSPLLGTQAPVKVPAPNEISPGTPRVVDETMKPSMADYVLIGEQNLFHPDRMITEVKKLPAPIVQPRPELILHGTMLTDELKIAYLEDKKAGQKNPRRGAPYIVVKEGDNVSGYILKQISESMVVLANGEEQMTLYLDELKDRKGEITGPTKAPAPAATAPSQAAPRPFAPQPAARPSMVQSVPSAPSGFSGPPNIRSAAPRPSIPAQSAPIRRGPP
ncbi:MAG TPA: hypothetical protein DCZ97_01745 [Syntrophus sp. (in: bacteria)]|nr:hypothetical protein [Syntrophus sp. (in: bacteria)]